MFAAEVPRGNRGLALVNVWSEGVNKAVEDIVHSVPCSWGVNVTLSTRLGSTNPQSEIDPKISFPTTNEHASGPENSWPASLGPKTFGMLLIRGWTSEFGRIVYSLWRLERRL